MVVAAAAAAAVVGCWLLCLVCSQARDGENLRREYKKILREIRALQGTPREREALCLPNLPLPFMPLTRSSRNTRKP